MIEALAKLGRRRSRIPFDMLALQTSAAEARAAEKLRNIYHRGQDLAWDGRAVLPDLIAKHGGITLPPEQKQALARIFEIILWGELAAWKISGELAAEIEPLEAKMAATSQAHDEARHFYVMCDYLRALGYQPTRIDPYSQKVLDLTLDSPCLAHKLLGMQLMIETIALTIFQQVRERRIEPVLADLLLYYEKDEARHVGLGLQYLPQLVRRMSRRQGLAMLAFQLRLIFWTLASLKAIEPDLVALGIDPRVMMKNGRDKQYAAFTEMWAATGVGAPPRDYIDRFIQSARELLFPTPENAGDLLACLRSARHAFLHPDAAAPMRFDS